MRNRLPTSLSHLRLTRNAAGTPERGAVFVGTVNGQRLWLTARDRSYGLLIIGAPGTGKTVLMKRICRQDVDLGHGAIVIDPMGPLFDDLVAYLAYRKATGRRVPETILFNVSEANWFLPYNTFLRREGELSVQVNHRVAATLRVWGQHNSDDTPRLEKWLASLYWVLIECNLTVLEAGWLLNQHDTEIRQLLINGVSNPLIRNKLDQLSRFRTAEFLQQIESVENRLMRFLTSGHLSCIFGPGLNAINFRSIMDEGKILAVKLQPSKVLSSEQAKLVGTLLLNEAFETALERPSGARPCYLTVDEAAQFVSLEMAEGLERLRQKGCHATFSFQHAAQFGQEGDRVYKAFKNVRNKIVFAVPDRQDALELADDLFAGLAEPQLKFMHRRLNHFVEDVREKSATQSHGNSQSVGQSQGRSGSRSQTDGQTAGWSRGLSQSTEQGVSRGRTFSRGKSAETSTSDSHSHSEHEAHQSGYSETTSRQHQSQRNTAETVNEHKQDGWFSSTSEDGRSRTSGHASNDSSSSSRTDTGGDSYESGDSTSHTKSTSRGANTSLAWSRSSQQSHGESRSKGVTGQRSHSEQTSASDSQSQSQEQGHSQSFSTTDQPGSRHHPFWEEDPEHWSLEEQRWRASELLMSQQTGHWFIRTSGAAGFGSNGLPPPFYIRPAHLLRLTSEFYQRHNFTKEQAERLIRERQQELLRRLPAVAASSSNGQDWSSTGVRSASRDGVAAAANAQDRSKLWNRVSTQPPRPGPKPDVENHAKVAGIVSAYGESWTTPDNLLRICEAIDKERVPVPKTWPEFRDHPVHSWLRALEWHRDLAKKAIRYSLKVTAAQNGKPAEL